MYVWIWVTIAAALSQSLRTAQQKNLQPVLGNLGASFVRFSYAIPFAWAWIIAYSYLFDISIPILNLKFFFWVTIAGITQIIFTVLLIILGPLERSPNSAVFDIEYLMLEIPPS